MKFEEIPNAWAVCFLSECPMKNECKRFQAGLLFPDDVVATLSIAPAVLKNVEHPCFHPIKTEHMAKGFKHIFDNVLKKDAVEMKNVMMNYLGGYATFYRYRSGKRLLNEEQQAWIKDYFVSKGYPAFIEYDDFEDVEVFHYPPLKSR